MSGLWVGLKSRITSTMERLRFDYGSTRSAVLEMLSRYGDVRNANEMRMKMNRQKIHLLHKNQGNCNFSSKKLANVIFFL